MKNADLQLHFYKDFSGGLNTKDAPNVINDNQLVEARNAVLGKGLIRKRDGTTKSNQTVPTGQVSAPGYALPLSQSGAGSSFISPNTYYVQIDYGDGTGRTTAGGSTSSATFNTSTSGQNITTTVVVPDRVQNVGVYCFDPNGSGTQNDANGNPIVTNTRIDFTTTAGTSFTSGTNYVLTVKSAYYSAFDAIAPMIKTGVDFVSNYAASPGYLLGLIESVDLTNRTVTVKAYANETSPTSNEWDGENIVIKGLPRVGTIAKNGTITYDGGLTSGLSVEVDGNTMYVTLSKPGVTNVANPPIAQTTNTTANSALGIVGLYEAYRSNGTTEFLNVTEGALFRNNGGTLTQIPGAPLVGSAAMVQYKDRNINDVVLLADGGQLKAYDFSACNIVQPHVPTTSEQTNGGLNDLSNLTAFRSIAIKKDRIFASAHPTVKNRVSFCWRDPDLGYAVYDYWPASFFFDVAPEDNDEILALIPYRDRIVIFMKRSIWDLQGDGTTITDYSLTKVNTPRGAVSAGSIQVVEDSIYYLTDMGLYALSMNRYGLLVTQFISDPITPSLEAYSLADASQVVAIYNDHKYLLSFPDGNTFVWDGLYNAYTMWTGFTPTAYGILDNVIYFGTSAGNVYYFDPTTSNDDGVAIDFLIRTRNNDFGNPAYLKQLISVMLKAEQYDAKTSQVDVTVVHDGANYPLPNSISTNTSLEWDFSNWDQTYWDFNPVVTNRTYVSKQGREIQYVMENNYLGQPCTIYQMDTQFMTLRV